MMIAPETGDRGEEQRDRRAQDQREHQRPVAAEFGRVGDDRLGDAGRQHDAAEQRAEDHGRVHGRELHRAVHDDVGQLRPARCRRAPPSRSPSAAPPATPAACARPSGRPAARRPRTIAIPLIAPRRARRRTTAACRRADSLRASPAFRRSACATRALRPRRGSAPARARARPAGSRTFQAAA